jgi:hypothetical protein
MSFHIGRIIANLMATGRLEESSRKLATGLQPII